MSRIALLFAFLYVFHAQAAVPIELIRDYTVDSIQKNTQLEQGQSQVVVHVTNLHFYAGEKILYGFDNDGFETILDETISFQFKLDPGEHFFQFYPPGKIGLGEITTEILELDAQTTTYISIHFQEERVHHLLRKPVVYLYPTETTDVSIKVKTAGELAFTYPRYDEKWECTASPTGELYLNGGVYNYLFWEADFAIDESDFNDFNRIKVGKNDLVLFLETALDTFGFTSKEKMDFITYWAPQMLQHKATEIRFMYNEDCSLFADLDIVPEPDHLLRFYMIWNPLDAEVNNPNTSLHIPTIKRSGFTALEWGGMEISPRSQLEQLVQQDHAQN